ncbi:MAG: CYTH and CHAD domain-containing protein [Actinomycetota bacterium]|nr:CYTH and CHAD domain-containing protein [Actinomycetota bacterium]
MAAETEREVKLGAWGSFQLPDLSGVLDGITASPPTARTLTASYYDTADLRLSRWGISVRHRDGNGAGWTVKLPEGDGGPALVRREVSFEGGSTRIPTGVLDLLRGYVRTSPLQGVARLRTHRRGVELRDAEGHTVAEVVDDEVSVLHGARMTARFREVEVEVHDAAAPELLDAVVERLQAAGAGKPDPTPKLVRALGPRALEPPDLAPVDVDEEASTMDAVRAALVGSVARMLAHDPGVRIGEHPRDVHQLRVGIRRLRSDLRTFRPVLDPEWPQPLRDELKWLAHELSSVRDADVLEQRLRRQAAELPDPDAPGLASLLAKLGAEREAARRRLREALASDRYANLLERLTTGALAPPLVGQADKSARRVLPKLVSRPWRDLRKAVDRLPPDPAPEDLHQVRILAKRARYAAEAAAPVVGKKAQRFAEAVAHVQSVLGDLQDAVVAEAWLREAGASAPAPQALVAGELISIQRAEGAASRDAWPSAWKRVDGKKLRSWLA